MVEADKNKSMLNSMDELTLKIEKLLEFNMNNKLSDSEVFLYHGLVFFVC